MRRFNWPKPNSDETNASPGSTYRRWPPPRIRNPSMPNSKRRSSSADSENDAKSAAAGGSGMKSICRRQRSRSAGSNCPNRGWFRARAIALPTLSNA
jgi:hypothetical protein